VAAWVARDPILARLELPAGGPRVALVGGAVRDALLGVAHGPDVDLVVEGDAIALARAVGRALGGRVVAHERFRTARVDFAHGRHLDVVTARRETYATPGALPDVVPGSLEDDLARRDFTVNAIAYVLCGEASGTLVDPHDGRADIGAERIRVIRPGAFPEDPSRVIRALRYAARLGFRMDAATEAEAREVAPTVTLERSRVADEAARMLAEASALQAVAMAAAIGVRWPDPDPRRDDRLAALDTALGRPGAPAPPAWALRMGLAVRPEDAADAALPVWARAVAAEVRDGLTLAPRLVGDARPSGVDTALRDVPPAAQVGALVGGAEVVARWWGEWRDCAPDVTGADLVAAGVAPGPSIGRALRAVRAAVLDGEVRGRGEQMALALAETGRFR
jgi:tRNA nucleotidyltransferase (CCA-adding enzyme)